MNKKKIHDVRDVIDLEYLQKFQDSLGNVTKITTAILDPHGIPISRATNLHSFCAMMQSSETGVKMCHETNAELAQINIRTRKPAILTCPNSGLKTAAIPIFLKEQYLGSWLIGQIRTEDIDLELIESTAVRAGLHPAEAKINISRLPVIPEEDFQNILELVDVMTKEITQLVEMNVELDEKNQKLIEMTDKLDISTKIFSDFIDLSDIGVYLSNYDSDEIIMFNNAFAKLIHRDNENIIGEKCYKLIGYESPCYFCPKQVLLENNGEPVVWEQYYETLSVWLQINSRVLKWTDNSIVYMATFVDITERKKREEEIEHLAYFDQRLDIPNEIRLFHDIKSIQNLSSYIICFDIQGLRKINDVYGRESGDILLRAIRDWILKDELFQRKLYKVGNDEFVILLHNVKNEKALLIANYLVKRFEEPWYIDLGVVHHQIYAGISIGIVPADYELSSASDLINILERILSVAAVKNHVVNYGLKENEDFHNHLKMEVSLKKCVLNDMEGFYLNYQPIVDPASGSWKGLEVLCRWISPDIGPLTPDIFIPEAEQNGLIGLIGEWVLRESIRQVKEWQIEQTDFILDVNLSPIQLNDKKLYERIAAILEEYDYPPDKLCLEITESAEVNFTDHILESFEKLCKLGISLSLDDFGTGYATFSSLVHLPVTYLKTDRSFMNNIERDPYLQNTLKIMVEFAHSSDMTVIAEGVENESQKQILQQLAVDYIQGYYYSKPMSAQDITENLNKFSIDPNLSQTKIMSNVDLHTLTSPERGYILPVSLYQTLIQCFHLIVRRNTKDPLKEILKLVVKKLNVIQTFIAYADIKTLNLHLKEWTKEEMHNPISNHALEEIVIQALELFQKEGLTAAFQDDINNSHLLILPIIKKGAVCGVAGLIEEKDKLRVWRLEEIQFLYYLCTLYENCIFTMDSFLS